LEIFVVNFYFSNRSRFGISERFKVGWPQTLGKAKPREIEIDLSMPRRLMFFKPNPKTNVIEDVPDMVFSRFGTRKYDCFFVGNCSIVTVACCTDFQDYKLEAKALSIELNFDQKQGGRKKPFLSRLLNTFVVC
jgi:hypothetical protein